MRLFCSLLPRLLMFAAAAALCSSALLAQQTLGGITGDVTDPSGSVIPNATVTLVDEQTALTRKTTTNGAGTYSFVNLPIGSYTVTYEATGFETQKTPHITVQGNRTATLNAQLKVAAAAGQTIEVDATPLMNAVDTTNGYVMDKSQIDTVPLATGSFTGLGSAIPWRECGALRWHWCEFRLGKRSHLVQRPARHVEQFSPQWRGRQQPVQRQEHEPGAIGARYQQHGRLNQRRRRRGDSDAGLRLSLDRQCDPDAGTRDPFRSSCQRVDV